MKRLLSCLAIALALTACQPRADESAGPKTYPALWEITGPDGQVEGWLFGTIHALPDDVEWQSPKLTKAMGDADMLVVEVANLDDGAALSKLFEDMAFDTPGGPIRQRIVPDLHEEFDKLLVEARVRSSYFDPMESWAAALALAQVAQDGESENGVDRALIDDFKGREIVELEGAKAQLSIFDSLPEKEQRDLLNAVLSEAAEYGDQSARLASVWSSGDLDELTRVSQRGILSDKELKQALLVDRNAAWTAQLENLFSANERPLVAVGAGHLLGPEGLPAQLEKIGYVVRRIE
ncbi:TraB/GumN family protein [Erythrobacter mangrovi]|uniref:TraB/GumN family protein n=1 Tax=Erythrobacter mangrovi TaxID=2739433 RepID=A0A7D3XQU3_9SPHN|nr:TraB/GumN family protein [Erythrobacter mangrovi]QKG71534.1 TraB/GumN family protein [Erythrobacter mangrovi]